MVGVERVTVTLPNDLIRGNRPEGEEPQRVCR